MNNAFSTLDYTTLEPNAPPSHAACCFKNTADLLAKHVCDTPYYLFSAKRLKQQADLFLQHFPGEVSYAVKASPHPEVIDTLFDAGICSFDVASLKEVKQIYNQHPSATLQFDNPIKSISAIRQSYQLYGVRSFAVDDQRGIEHILRSCEPSPQNLEITVRFSLPHNGSAYDFGTKFGATPTEAVALLQRINKANQRASLTFHPGTQCTDPAAYQRYIDAAQYIAKQAGCPIYRLNVGGGFPAAYPNFQISNLIAYFDAIQTAFLTTSMAKFGTTLICEPGRAMVTDCISLLTRVIHKREDQTLFINDGVYGSFAEQLVFELELPTRCWRQNKPLIGETQKTKVFGPTCDSLDQITKTVDLPRDLQIDDYIEFGMMGAYSFATASGFNGFDLPKMLCVNEGFNLS